MALKVLLEKFRRYPKLTALSVGNGLKHRNYCFENSTKDDNDNLIQNFKCVNEVRLLGIVGEDPKQYSSVSTQLIHFPMATSGYFGEKKGSSQKYTTWHNIVVRKPYLQDYVLKYVVKGTRIYVSGFIDDRPIACEDFPLLKGSLHVVAVAVISLKRPYGSRDENFAFVYGSEQNLEKGGT